MAQPLFKLMILIVAINTILFIGGVRVIGGDDANMINNFIEVNKTADGQIIVNPGLVDTLPTSFERSGSDVLNFVDSIAVVGKFVVFAVNIVFTPLGLFTSAGMPVNITLMVGMPLMIGLFLATAYFIRSGS